MKTFNDPKQMLNETNLVNHFIDLAKIHTTSDDNSETCPSTKEQLIGMNTVKEKLFKIGLTDAQVDENGYVYAKLATNQDKAPTIGLIAHIDTSPDAPGKDVKPIIHENYDGTPIKLKNDVTISPEETPELKLCIGHTIITADGTTLLGADDKAGIAEILATLEFLQKNPDIARPNISVCITPDEEIGRGANKFDYERFAADCAYTLDGDFMGRIDTETFNAESATVTFHGISEHPGYAKNKMVNAVTYASKFIQMMPANEVPERTEGREGFYHLDDIVGNLTKCSLKLILRDHDKNILKQRGETLHRIREQLLKEEPKLKIDLEIKHSYDNMGEYLAKNPEIVAKLKEAVTLSGLTPESIPVRGGTDGARLSAKGLLTPNIFTGMMNFHGLKEWASTTGMGYTVCTVINLLQLWTK